MAYLKKDEFAPCCFPYNLNYRKRDGFIKPRWPEAVFLKEGYSTNC